MRLKRYMTKNPEIQFIIGPDGVRDTNQMKLVAHCAVDNGISDLRGGVMKPRSAPRERGGRKTWRGLGIEEGIGIVLESLCGFSGSFVTEVWSPDHVKKIEYLTRESHIVFHKQIGARTGPGNLIEEIASAMAQGPKQARLVVKNQMEVGDETFKNRILWANEGIDMSRIIAGGRGHVPGSDGYRHTPNLETLLYLRQTIPELDILLDISHTAGMSSENVEKFACTAVDFHNAVLDKLGIVLLDKIMIEMDPNPELAQCDRDQLLTPLATSKLVSKIRKNIRMTI